jgi:hypothetical protein
MSMFQKRHYEFVAEIIKNYRAETSDEAEHLHQFTSKLCDAFEGENPKFAPDIFMRACGYQYKA